MQSSIGTKSIFQAIAPTNFQSQLTLVAWNYNGIHAGLFWDSSFRLVNFLGTVSFSNNFSIFVGEVLRAILIWAVTMYRDAIPFELSGKR
jgi:hypothetical protein